MSLLLAISSGGGPGSYVLTATRGIYTLSGQNNNLLKGYKVQPVVGTYILSGQSNLIILGRTIILGSGTYAVSSNDIILKKLSNILANVGTYSVNGTTANLMLGKALAVVAGVYDLVGIPVTLTYNPLGGGGGGVCLTSQQLYDMKYSVAVIIAHIKALNDIGGTIPTMSASNGGADATTSELNTTLDELTQQLTSLKNLLEII